MRMRLYALLMALCACCLAGMAQASADLSLAENINTPDVPKRALKPIQKHLEQISQSLSKHYSDVELLRNQDVVLVTIPCSDLFAPNSTDLRESGKRFLRPFVTMLKYPTMYKVLVAVHTDNTGDQQYQDEISSARADAIFDFLCDELGTEAQSLVPYGIGSEEPLELNNSVTNRARNRRVEIYIVPAQGMIETAKAGKLS